MGTILYNKVIFLKPGEQNIVYVVIICGILVIFVHLGGFYRLSKLAHFLSLTLLSSDLITRTNRIDLD